MESGSRASPPSLHQQPQTGDVGLSVLQQQLPTATTTGRDVAAADGAATGVRAPQFSAAVAALQQQQQRAAAATAGALPLHLLRLQQQQSSLKQQQAAAAAAFAALQQQEHAGNAVAAGGQQANSSLEQQQALLAALHQQQRIHEQQQQQALAAAAAVPQSSAPPPAHAQQSPPVTPEKVFWVQCDRCDKWRVAPYQINATTWVCEQNTWDPRYASCAAVEQADPTLAAALALGGGSSNSNGGGGVNASGRSGGGPPPRAMKQIGGSPPLSMQQQAKTGTSSRGRSGGTAGTVGFSLPGGVSSSGTSEAVPLGGAPQVGRNSKSKATPPVVPGDPAAVSAPPAKKPRGKGTVTSVPPNSATSDASSSPGVPSVPGDTPTSALMAAAAAGLPFSAAALHDAQGAGPPALRSTTGTASPHHSLLPQQLLLKAGNAAVGASSVGEQQHSILQQQLLPHMQQQNMPAAVAAAAAAAQQQRAVSAAVAAAVGLPAPALLQQPHLLQLQLQQQLQQPQLLLEHWVQCDACNKWRRAPMQITTEKWYCRMNTWAPQYASCDAPEEPDPAAAEQQPSEEAVPVEGQPSTGVGRQHREITGKRQRGSTSGGARGGKGKGRGKAPGGRGGGASVGAPGRGRHQATAQQQQQRQQGDSPRVEDGGPLVLSGRDTSSHISGRPGPAVESPATVAPPLNPSLLQRRQQQQQQLASAGTASTPTSGGLKPGDTSTRSNSVGGILQKPSSGEAVGVLQGCSAAAAQFAAALAAQQHQLLQAAAARLSGGNAGTGGATSPATLPGAASVVTPPASLSSLITAGGVRPSSSTGGSTDASADTEAGTAAEAGRRQMRWACCTSCGKWRRVPEEAVFKGGRFCCYMNVWNPALCSCSAPQEPFQPPQPPAATPPKPQHMAAATSSPHSHAQLSAVDSPAVPQGVDISKETAFPAGGREDERGEEGAAVSTTLPAGVGAASTGASLLLGMLSQQASLQQQQRLQQLLSQQQQQQGGAVLLPLMGEGFNLIPELGTAVGSLSGSSSTMTAGADTKAGLAANATSTASSAGDQRDQDGLGPPDNVAVERDASARSGSTSSVQSNSNLGVNADARGSSWQGTGRDDMTHGGDSSPAANSRGLEAAGLQAEEKEEQQKPPPDSSGPCAPASRPSPGDEDDPDRGSGSSSNMGNVSGPDGSSSGNSGDSTSSNSKGGSQSGGRGGVGASGGERNCKETANGVAAAATEGLLKGLRRQLSFLSAAAHLAVFGSACELDAADRTAPRQLSLAAAAAAAQLCATVFS